MALTCGRQGIEDAEMHTKIDDLMEALSLEAGDISTDRQGE